MTLEVEIYTRNLNLSERIEEYVNKKVGKLDRYLSNIDEARVDLAHVKSARSANDRHVAQITVRGRGYILRSEESADTIFAAIDAALDKMQRRIQRYKGKRYRGREPRPEDTAFAELPPLEEEEEEEPIIARRKRFTLLPMDELEAVEQMQLLGHDNFFVFYNANTSAINVLYRRRDGTYGLIEPEIG
ncbi:MAG: ribosome-associated translation inhibitor RaiA [Anaerolineae bacterium]|nr:MAG: ribosome-associated translation inhibitor RaiA [Anaerolineae bacterium]